MNFDPLLFVAQSYLTLCDLHHLLELAQIVSL